LGRVLPSAKRNNAFCFFFWKKKKITIIFFNTIIAIDVLFLGAKPPNPLGRLRRGLGYVVVSGGVIAIEQIN
jgi:hypothetical protein